MPMTVEVGEDFIRNEILKKLVDKEIRTVNSGLEEYETIKKFTILTRRLTVQDGDMTPTFKVKRKVVIDKHNDLIDRMYNASGPFF